MSVSKISEIRALSNLDISEAILKTQKDLFNLRLKKSVRQSFKSSEIKYFKRRLAQLKTILTLRLNKIEYEKSDVIKTIL